MRRLFNAHVQLVYADEQGEARVSSSVADRTEFWWNERKPEEPTLWESKIYLGEEFFNEIISHPVPARHEYPHGAQAVLLGTRSLFVAGLPHLHASRSTADHLAAGVPAVWSPPLQGPVKNAPFKTSAGRCCES